MQFLLFFFKLQACKHSDCDLMLHEMFERNNERRSCLRINIGLQFFKIKIFFYYQSNYLHGRKLDVCIHIYKTTFNCDLFKFFLQRVTAIARNGVSCGRNSSSR